MTRLLVVALLSLSSFAQTSIRLADVRKVYIEKMPNNLDQYLRSSLLKTFRDRLTVVLDRSLADAILSEAPRGAQDTKTIVNLTDARGHVVLWSGTAGDRDENFLWLKHGGEQKVADRLANQLKKAMEP